MSLPSPRADVRRVLVELVTEHGPSLLTGPRRVEGFLRDLCGEHTAEISVVLAAMRHGIVEELRQATDQQAWQSKPASLLLPALSTRLREDAGVDASLAHWAVATWAIAFGLITSDDMLANDQASPEAVRTFDTVDPGGSTAALSVELPGYQPSPPRRARHGRRRIAIGVAAMLAAGGIAAGLALTGALNTGGTGGTGSLEATGGATLATPALGTYYYETTITGGPNPGRSTSSIVVDKVNNEIGLAYVGFGDPLIESDLTTWGPRQVVVTSVAYLDQTDTPVSNACIWRPPLVHLVAPLTKGASWSNDARCTIKLAGATTAIEEKTQARVQGAATVKLPSGSREAVEVDMTEADTVTPQGQPPRQDQRTVRYEQDPATGILLSETAEDHTRGSTLIAEQTTFVPSS